MNRWIQNNNVDVSKNNYLFKLKQEYFFNDTTNNQQGKNEENFTVSVWKPGNN